MNTERRTDYLVLRKTPYGDTSLVVAGLTRDCGQVHFMVRGGRRIDRSTSPTVDLFRLLHIVYSPGRSGLSTWRQADVVEDYRAVAGNLELCRTAGWLARFALANTCEAVETTQVFAAMRIALRDLATAAVSPPPGLAESVKCCLGLAFLAENGLLPDYGDDLAAKQRLALLRHCAVGLVPRPKLTHETWRELWAWTLSLLADADCTLPDTLSTPS